VTTEGQAGAAISEVTSGSGAEAAGIQAGDVIIGFDGVPILGIADLQAQVRSHQPGETVEILVIRDGDEVTVTATLGVNTEEVG
jgi:S1-C subfamily serine protease